MIEFIICLVCLLIGVAVSLYQIAHADDQASEDRYTHTWFLTLPM